ncbi:uncharacterized protein C8Q71DRAFT_279960 [Rhodofomes roseus]|uniref:DUF6533 domain-containing protein n=1 Tax=Rhodofomes roseus TaxID=34475 RepID=A0ABQ8K559_9APHY|nr:uncharacterized protein C8Q71DRAFT_279960 [Rhodofomes roseus]KAH9832057.1 hypothetical protein C8Q71DRAFT_279960 [Rhodofomes roseus]
MSENQCNINSCILRPHIQGSNHDHNHIKWLTGDIGLPIPLCLRALLRMDNSTAISLQQLEAAANVLFAGNCAWIASLCFYMFDLFLTIDQQVAFIWSRKLSIPTLLLLLLHLSNILLLVTFIGEQSPLNCK